MTFSYVFRFLIDTLLQTYHSTLDIIFHRCMDLSKTGHWSHVDPYYEQRSSNMQDLLVDVLLIHTELLQLWRTRKWKLVGTQWYFFILFFLVCNSNLVPFSRHADVFISSHSINTSINFDQPERKSGAINDYIGVAQYSVNSISYDYQI